MTGIAIYDMYNRTQNEFYEKTVATTVQVGSSKGSLTNLTGLIDAWGKPIPYTWGNIRVGGVGIWGSPYYEEIGTFKTTTEYFNEYTMIDYIRLSPDKQVSEKVGDTVITNSDKVKYAIDLAYSFGFEGILSGNREIVRLRLNGKIVFDKDTGYIEPGIGFSIRSGKDLTIDPIMSQYADTGKYFYNAQTYVIFEKFKPEFWGNSLPTSIDAEFRQQDDLGDVEVLPFAPYGKVYSVFKMIFYPERRRVYYIDKAEDGSDALHVFNLDTGGRLADIKLTGPAVEYLVANYGRNMQGGSATNTGLFDCRVCAEDYGKSIAIDLRNGNCIFIAEFIYTNSMFLWSADQDKATVYHGRQLGAKDMYRINLSRVGSEINVSFSDVEIPIDQSLPNSGSSNYGAIDADGAGFAVLALTGAGENEVLIWNNVVGDGKVLDYGQSDGWQVLDVLSHQKQAYVLSYKVGASQYKISRYDNFGTLINSLVGDDSNLNLQLFKARGEGRRGKQSNRFIAAYQPSSINKVAYINLDSLSVLIFSSSGYELEYAPFDPATNKIYYSNTNGTGETGLIGPSFKSARVKLFDFMRSLYVLSNIYEPNQIRQDGLINDTIIGAMIITNTSVDEIIKAICTIYKINKIDTVDGVYFFKTRSTTEGLTIALQLDISQLADDAESGDDSKVLRTSRANKNQTPSQIDLKFIDPNNEYKDNSVSWRRTNAGITRGTSTNVALPFVMTQAEALKLVQSATVEGENRVHTHEFRLPPRYSMLVVPGDIIQITHGTYKETIQLVNIDINGDFSGSCFGVTIVDESVVPLKTPEFIPPKAIDLAKTTPSIGYVIDSPTLTVADDAGNGLFIQYDVVGPATKGSYNGGYLGRKPSIDLPWESLPIIKSQSVLTRYIATSKLSDKQWVRDDDPLSINLITGTNPAMRSNSDLQKDGSLNLAWYGKPGRWEIIQFEGVTNGTIVGIIRGRRGTEVFSGLHEVGDFVILPTVSVIAEKRELSKVGANENYKAVSVGIPFGTVEEMPTHIPTGLSTYPFAPSNIEWSKETNGDITIKWMRRDRLSTGWGKEFSPTDLREYRVGIYNNNSTSEVRFYEVTEAETVTYSLTDQTEDGLSTAETLKLKIAQKGQLGYGFAKVETI